MTGPSRRHWWAARRCELLMDSHLGEHPSFYRIRLDHPDDPSGFVWTDGASNVSRPDPSGADQTDAEHPARNRKVEGSNPSSGSKTAGQTASRALSTGQRHEAVIPLDWTSRRRRIGPASLCRCSSGISSAVDGDPSSAHDGRNYGDGRLDRSAGRARTRAHPRNQPAATPPFLRFIDRYAFAGCPAQAVPRLAELKGFRAVNAAHSLEDIPERLEGFGLVLGCSGHDQPRGPTLA
jgi:hypothetical protein